VYRRHKRTIAIVAATALAALGGGAAYATTSATDRHEELLNDAAQRLDVSPEELRSALEGAFGDQLDEAVRDGTLTQRQADRIKQQIRAHGLPLGGPAFGPPHGDVHVAFGPGLDAAADYLGLTQDQLGRRLANGRSLAQIARAEGRSVEGLEQAILAAAEQQLDEAVSDGDLTDAQRDRMLADLREHVDELVAGSGRGPLGAGPRHHRFGGPGGHGPGGPGGPPPWRD
jgi:hypothetical protein